MQPTQPTQLDPQLVNLAKAIRQTESNGNFQAQGKSGEYGAYQFMPSTWANASQKFLGTNVPLNQATPEQQNEVAYKQLADWKQQNPTWNVGNFASAWNAGPGKPDAYLTGNSGTNSYGASYDTAAYAKNVATAYQQFKAQTPQNTPQQGQNPLIPTADASIGADQSQTDQPMSVGGFIGNVFNSGANVIGGLANAALHPIKTLETVGSIAGGAYEKATNALGLTHINNQDTQTVDNLVGFLKNRYGGDNAGQIAHNIIHTAYTDPVGVALDLSTLIDGVGAGVSAVGKISDISKIGELTQAADLAKTADFVAGANGIDTGANVAADLTKQATTPGVISQVGNTLKSVADATNPLTYVGKGASMVASGVGRLAGESAGLATGVGYGAIKAGIDATAQGGDAGRAFAEGLKGSVSPEEVVTQARDALGQVVSNRDAEYQTMLDGLKADKSTYDISPVIKETDNQLNKFNIKTKDDGTLDFSRSKFALDTTAQKDVQNLYDYVRSYGTKEGDLSAVGIDNLKKVVGSYYSPNSDYRAFTEGIRKATRSVLEESPGYTKEMKAYGDMTDQIKDIKQGLSLGDKAMVETTFKKLTSSLRQNNEFRTQIIRELDAATGGKLIPLIAGQQLSSLMPRGLAKYADIGVLGHILTGGTGIVPLLFTSMTTSPRLVGEFIRGLGLGSKITDKILEFINSKIPLNKASILNVGKNANSSQKQ